MKLTETKVKNSKPADKPFKLPDGDGLFLSVKPNGSRLWLFRYRYADKENMVSLGKYPDVSLSNAREKRYEARKLLSNGIDPSSKKREERQYAIYKTENTFEAIARQWHETNEGRWSGKHGKRVLERLENHIFKRLGRRPIEDIKALEILSVLKKVEVEGKGKIDTAHRLLQYCNAVFRFAIITGRIENNPAGNLTGALKPKRQTHYRTIKSSEIKNFLAKLETVQTSLQNKFAVKLLMLTFLRTGELRQSKWVHINFETREWKVPSEIMKMKRPHLVPISTQVLALLNELKHITGYSEYIFPSKQKKKHPYMSENTINYVIDKMDYADKIVGHGFRSLASTTLNELGFRPDVIEKQLAHAERNSVRAAYNHAEYIPERIMLMQAWADYVDGAVSADDEKVVQVKFGKA